MPLKTACVRISYAIAYYIVLAYMPSGNDPLFDEGHTILPDGIELINRRFAITYRNKWMIDQSDYVITYVTNEAGSGAAKFKKLAEKKGKTVISLQN